MKNENKFKVVDKEGNETTFEILFTFESDETKKNYMVYTDNTKDDDGNNVDNYLSNTILKFESANSSQLTTTYSGQSEDGVMITATVH